MSETERTATEILSHTSKAFLMFQTGLKVAQERLEEAASWERKVETAKREASSAIQSKAEAERSAGETVRKAATDVDLIVTSAKAEAKRVLDEAAVIAADNDRLRGETGDLQATKTKLLADVQRLTKTVADLEAIR